LPVDFDISRLSNRMVALELSSGQQDRRSEMEKIMSWILSVWFIVIASAVAQTSPAVVNADRTVTFMLRAPLAQKVVVNGDFPLGLRNLDMQKNEAGEWTTTTSPLPRGSYYFRFVVDGLPVLLSPPGLYVASSASMELVHIRGEEALPYELPDPRMPRGEVSIHTFYSDVLERPVKYAVYTPPGYECSHELYPIVYLLHGNAGIDPSPEDGKQRSPVNPLMWMDLGFADRITDRLIADKAIRPAILVSIDSQGPRAQPPVTPEAELASLVTFERYLVEDVMPRVERRYRVQPGQPYRSLAGVSRGAIQALHVAFRRPDLFSGFGVFSPGTLLPFPDLYPMLRDARMLNSQIRLHLAVGQQDTIAPFAAAQNIHETLERLDVRHIYVPSEGEHSFQNWRLYLADFLKTAP
jgi:enterochelin esterase-like enzyme